jgi:hypothetical protein
MKCLGARLSLLPVNSWKTGKGLELKEKQPVGPFRATAHGQDAIQSLNPVYSFFFVESFSLHNLLDSLYGLFDAVWVFHQSKANVIVPVLSKTNTR